MPKPVFQATAEGLPNRRQFLGSLVAGSAVGAVSAGAVALALPAAAAPAAQPSPDERINIAMNEIRAALVELYPGWEFQTENRVMRPMIYEPSAPDRFVFGEPHRHSVLIYAYERRYGAETARVFVDTKYDEVAA